MKKRDVISSKSTSFFARTGQEGYFLCPLLPLLIFPNKQDPNELNFFALRLQVVNHQQHSHSQSLLNSSSNSGPGLGFPPKSQIKRQKMIYHCKVKYEAKSCSN